MEQALVVTGWQGFEYYICGLHTPAHRHRLAGRQQREKGKPSYTWDLIGYDTNEQLRRKVSLRSSSE
jgi:hypothetical protein